MTDESATALSIGFSDEDDETADELAEWLRNNGGTDVVVHRNTGEPSILFIPLVVGVAIAAAALVKVVIWVHDHWQYEQVVTYHDGKAEIQIVKIRNGKIIIFADKDTVVQLESVPDVLDLTDIAKTALGSAEKAAADAIKAGAKAEVAPAPSDPETKTALERVAA